HAAAGRGPVGVRFPRGTGFGVSLDAPLAELALGISETLRDGSDLALIAYGQPVRAAVEAAEMLAREGLEATVVNARFTKPLDAERLLALAARIPRFLTIEEHVIAGGFGSAVAELLAEGGARVDLERLAHDLALSLCGDRVRCALRRGGEKEHGDVGPAHVATEYVEYVDAVEAGKGDVEDQQVGWLALLTLEDQSAVRDVLAADPES